jgi:hypothetical protein
MPTYSTRFLALVVLALVVLLTVAEFGPALLSGKAPGSADQSLVPAPTK